jgi:hypothetical protein
MRDGIELSANLWMPEPREPGETFPAILEMIPYRKDDWRYNTDAARMTYFAQRGYVGCRVDVRGTGSSQGLALDEYTEAETRDGYDVVEWLGTQAWSNGSVGMWGVSYGGFTSIQVAALQPPHLKAIVPMYATDDRYSDDVHYHGGCLMASEQYGYCLSMIGMNALPPKADYIGADWAQQWKERLEKTPPWILNWLKRQADGAYWRTGSLAPDYGRIACAIFSIAGWMDGYTNAALRMHEKCVNAAGRKTLVGNWSHSMPSDAYPGPHLDYLHEMTRFFDHWLKGINNGVMAEPAVTLFRREYTRPEAFPEKFNGEWTSEVTFPIERTQRQELFLNDTSLTPTPPHSHTHKAFPHRPTHGAHAAVGWCAGHAPYGLARDLRPDEALIPTYTTSPLTEPLDLIGFPEAVLHISASAPVAHLVVRLNDVAPDGAPDGGSAAVTMGALNLTHRESHAQPKSLVPGEVYEVRVPLKAAGYRFQPGHRLRLSVASGYWPLLWPSPYKTELTLHHGPDTPSRLILPIIPHNTHTPTPPHFKTTPPELLIVGGGSDETPVWQITEDVLAQSVTVRLFGGGMSHLPDGRTSLLETERIELTAYHHDPARVYLSDEAVYHLEEQNYKTRVCATSHLRSDAHNFHIDIQLVVMLNGEEFFRKAWLESVPRQGL